MEQYSQPLQEWVAKQLAQADTPTFLKLLAYYQARGGPGLVLAEAEAQNRNLPFTPTPTTHAYES